MVHTTLGHSPFVVASVNGFSVNVFIFVVCGSSSTSDTMASGAVVAFVVFSENKRNITVVLRYQCHSQSYYI